MTGDSRQAQGVDDVLNLGPEPVNELEKGAALSGRRASGERRTQSFRNRHFRYLRQFAACEITGTVILAGLANPFSPRARRAIVLTRVAPEVGRTTTAFDAVVVM